MMFTCSSKAPAYELTRRCRRVSLVIATAGQTCIANATQLPRNLKNRVPEAGATDGLF
jgi:hypothetical protein